MVFKPAKALKSYYNLLSAFAGFLFVSLYCILSYYNSFAADDFFYINDVHHAGIIGTMFKYYREWGGRWITCLHANIIYYFSAYKYTIFIYGFITIILFTLSINILLRNVLLKLNINLNKLKLFAFSSLILSFLFFTSFNIPEIWFWNGATASYLYSVIFMTLGFGLILNGKKSFILKTLIFICFFITGGESETYAIVIFLILIFALVLSYRNKLILSLRKDIYIALTGFIISFIITCLAPGNQNRMLFLPHPDILKASLITFKFLANILLHNIIQDSGWYLLFFLIFIRIGYEYRDKFKIINNALHFKLSSALLIIMVFISIFSTVYLLSDYPPGRCTFQITYFIAIYVLFWSIRIGAKIKLNDRFLSFIINGLLLILIVLFLLIIYSQVGIVKKYAKAVDNRKELLEQLRAEKNSKTIDLKSLPASGYLFSSEISTDTNSYLNKNLKHVMNLGFNVKREK
ncbi:MAG: DUF6056 family protein [Bacteroidota bacterium]|nr:DUF6056 family protein [Bacteroidota bacterium]